MISTTSESGSARRSPSATTPARASRESNSAKEAVYDAKLVSRFRSGEESAFDEIVTRYREKMFSVAYHHLHNHADAEEVAQDTLIRAHRGLVRFRGDCSLATWLHSIARNLSHNRYLHNFRRRRHAMLSLDYACSSESKETIADMIACDSPNPARAAAFCEFTETVARCMGDLRAGQREILTHRNILSQSYGEISAVLGISIGTVKSRIARARENLRVLLAGAYPEMASEVQGEGLFEPSRSFGRIATVSA
jgi:RNA polymerase sigma-70 factor (ECF subfamily)